MKGLIFLKLRSYKGLIFISQKCWAPWEKLEYEEY